MIKRALQFVKEVILYIAQLIWTTHDVETEEYTLSIENLKKQFRFVHLSDIHYDYTPVHEKSQIFFTYQRVSKRSLKDIESKIKAMNDIDAILLTGDYIQYESDAIHRFISDFLVPLVESVKPRAGTYLVLGNHDHKKQGGKQIVVDALKKVKNVTLLENESDITKVVADLSEWNLEVLGLPDKHDPCYATQCNKIYQRYTNNENKARIILSHNPDSVWDLRVANLPFSLLLCGHSHGGQIRVPVPLTVAKYLYKQYDQDSIRIEDLDKSIVWIPAQIILSYMINAPPLPASVRKWVNSRWIILFIMRVVRNWQYGAGGLVQITEKGLGERYVYCNRGVATHPPLRLFCGPIVSNITLVPAK